MNEQQDDLGPGCYCPPANVGDGIKPQSECPVHAYLTTEQQGSDESGEGLSEALRKAARDHIGLSEGEFWPSSIADAQAVAVERILADRLAAVRAERDVEHAINRRLIARAESAEAALATARREADEMRARLAAVEALTDVEEMERAMWRNSGMREDLLPLAAVPAAAALRAALANPSAAQGESEVGAACGYNGWLNGEAHCGCGRRFMHMQDFERHIGMPDSLATDADGSGQ